LTPADGAHADAYRLLDTGGGRKLEQVGPWTVNRTAAQAFWAPKLPARDWDRAHAFHHRSDQGGGRWETRAAIPARWPVALGGLELWTKLTPFGHLGLFAEHASQWSWLRDAVGAGRGAKPIEVLNLFAYTGGATLACSQAGAAVCHVDAAKGVVDWARDNAALNGLSDRPVRWIVDDCAAFLKREQRRGHRYQGLVIDPPTYGRSARKVWKIGTIFRSCSTHARRCSTRVRCSFSFRATLPATRRSSSRTCWPSASIGRDT
jgi:23S rRNA (cytosine1962-C5)-methyltransferase